MEIIGYKKQQVVDWWKAILVEPELADRAALIYLPMQRTPDLAVPLGKYRRTGYVSCSDVEMIPIIMERLARSPLSFPNLRLDTSVPVSHGYLSIPEIVWGDDITDLWLMRDSGWEGVARDAHRAIGRAFGYKEARILKMYPDDWKKPKYDTQ